LSMPAVVGRRGIIKAMPVELDETEKKELETCARGLRAVIEGAEKELSADKELAKALEMDKGT
jgi:L-lactate dehydrogenase